MRPSNDGCERICQTVGLLGAKPDKEDRRSQSACIKTEMSSYRNILQLILDSDLFSIDEITRQVHIVEPR